MGQSQRRMPGLVFGPTRLKNLAWEIVSERMQKQGWSPASRYRYESALSRFFVFCKRQGWMAFNIAEGQDRADSTKRRERTYTNGEWDRLLEAADDRGGDVEELNRTDLGP